MKRARSLRSRVVSTWNRRYRAVFSLSLPWSPLCISPFAFLPWFPPDPCVLRPWRPLVPPFSLVFGWKSALFAAALLRCLLIGCDLFVSHVSVSLQDLHFFLLVWYFDAGSGIMKLLLLMEAWDVIGGSLIGKSSVYQLIFSCPTDSFRHRIDKLAAGKSCPHASYTLHIS